MKCPSQLSLRSPVRFNITPLIDVVFLLIIFFLVASHFVRNEQAETVRLPDAGQGNPDHDAAPFRLTITVKQDGRLFIGIAPQSPESVRNQMAALRAQAAAAGVSPQVRIRPDRHAAYGQIRTLIEAAAAQNIRSIQFAVDKAEP